MRFLAKPKRASSLCSFGLTKSFLDANIVQGECKAKSSRSNSPLTSLLFTLLYTHFCPQKNHSIIHIPNVYCWFPMEKRMKHCLFKYSHRVFKFLSFTSWFKAVFLCEGLLPPPITGIHRPCECFKDQPFTPKTLKIRRKHALCEGSECFFGEIITYIRARKGQI